MTFKDYLISKRPHAEQTLTETLQMYKVLYEKETWSQDVLSTLESAISKGKLMRFSLAQLGYEGYSSIPSKSIQTLGICLECVHTGLLFHDDVMDEDEKRRGSDALHVRYAKKYGQSARDSKLFGESLATCVGDFAFFISFDFISHSDMDAGKKGEISSIVSREFACVSLAQMQDVSFGQTSTEPKQEEIIRMYRGKTGRYSVALPLVCGAIVASAPQADIDLLWSVGESLGVLFQIRDDFLSLFGDDRKTGKPVGSDLMQNKKTLYREYLMTHSDQTMKAKLQSIFGEPELSNENLIYVRRCLEQTETIKYIDTYCLELSKHIKTDITKLNMKQSERDILCDFLSFVTNRNV
jgi:geranylgeranyl diphosphate synthase type I